MLVALLEFCYKSRLEATRSKVRYLFFLQKNIFRKFSLTLSRPSSFLEIVYIQEPIELSQFFVNISY